MAEKNTQEENSPAQNAPSEARRRVAPRQSNHEGYMLPTCLADLPAMPLYLAVAHYGLLTHQMISRELICQAFHIDARRALEVMRYLVNGAPRVTCECVSLMQGRGYCLRIDTIAPPEADGQPTSVPRRPRRNSTEEAHKQQRMRQWFLRRPNP